MHIHYVDLVLVVACALFACIPLDRKRTRACWANWVFVVVGTIGVAMSLLRISMDLQWIALGADAAYRVHGGLHFIRGLLLGLVVSLILSRELLGAKKQQ